MAVRQYIGARYVTKVYENSLDPGSAEWESGINYEPLTMVTYNMGSYLSKKEVPASVGDPSTNPQYWTQTGFYNGQIAWLDSIKQNKALDTPVTVDGVSEETVQDALTALGTATGRKVEQIAVSQYVEEIGELAQGSYVHGDYFLAVDGYFYMATGTITAGSTTLDSNTNCTRTTISEQIKTFVGSITPDATNVTSAADAQIFRTGDICIVNYTAGLNGNLASSSVIGTIPNEFRPKGNRNLRGYSTQGGSSGEYRFVVNTSGEIRTGANNLSGDVSIDSYVYHI